MKAKAKEANKVTKLEREINIFQFAAACAVEIKREN